MASVSTSSVKEITERLQRRGESAAVWEFNSWGVLPHGKEIASFAYVVCNAEAAPSTALNRCRIDSRNVYEFISTLGASYSKGVKQWAKSQEFLMNLSMACDLKSLNISLCNHSLLSSWYASLRSGNDSFPPSVKPPWLQYKQQMFQFTTWEIFDSEVMCNELVIV